MARYIDANALLKKAERVYNYGLAVSVDEIKNAPSVVEGIIGEILSVEVSEVRHGEWIGNWDYSCSVCGKIQPDFDTNDPWNYCPNCGADMRGGKPCTY